MKGLPLELTRLISEVHVSNLVALRVTDKQFNSITKLQWQHIVQLAKPPFSMRWEDIVQCRELELCYTQIGDVGMTALSEALGKGALDKLTHLCLYHNQFGDVGLQALSDAL